MLMPLDYSYCRALAWLAALRGAQSLLPNYVEKRLWQIDLDPVLGKLAVCALAMPVDVATPDISASADISVYLRKPRDLDAEIAKILRDPQLLIMEMGIVRETEKAIKQMRETWPSSVAEARKNIIEIETLSEALSGLWKAMLLNDGGEKALELSAALAPAAQAPNSASANLMAADALLAAGRPQMALEAAAIAVRETEKFANADENQGKGWPYLLAKALYLRGIAHWRLDQLALAEKDMEASSQLLREFSHAPRNLAKVLQARGALRAKRRNFVGMCADFINACAYGLCEPLAEARRQGRCLPGGN